MKFTGRDESHHGRFMQLGKIFSDRAAAGLRAARHHARFFLFSKRDRPDVVIELDVLEVTSAEINSARARARATAEYFLCICAPQISNVQYMNSRDLHNNGTILRPGFRQCEITRMTIIEATSMSS